jgi:hypothetical protein
MFCGKNAAIDLFEKRARNTTVWFRTISDNKTLVYFDRIIWMTLTPVPTRVGSAKIAFRTQCQKTRRVLDRQLSNRSGTSEIGKINEKLLLV